MARVFLIFSILIGLGAAFLGFKAKTQAEVLQEDIKTQKAALVTAQASEKKAKAEAADLKKSLEQAQTDLATKEKEATDAKTAAETAKTELAKAQEDVKSKEAELAKVEQARKDLEAKIGPVPPEQLASKIQELTDAKTKLETEMAEAAQLRDSFKKKAEEAEAQFAAKDRQIAEYKGNYVRNGLTGKVLAYNPGWNFVVLNVGDKAGLKSGVQLVVTRAGAMIGKVRVSTVEPSTSIADVLPGTIARGESVQPGDSVVFEGQR